MKLCMGQINTFVGDWHGNRDRILEVCLDAHRQDPTAVVVFPELTLSGYPPEDLLLRPGLVKDVEEALADLCEKLPPSLWVIIGYPRRTPDGLFNAAGVLHEGAVVVRWC